MNYNVVEHFISINGEGVKAGELAVFVRFKGCNLNCEYCDTRWANTSDVRSESMSIGQIVDEVCKSNINNVTLTGGEPLIHPKIEYLVGELLKDGSIRVDIETNGSVDIRELVFRMEDAGYEAPVEQLIFTVDYIKSTISKLY